MRPNQIADRYACAHYATAAAAVGLRITFNDSRFLVTLYSLDQELSSLVSPSQLDTLASQLNAGDVIVTSRRRQFRKSMGCAVRIECRPCETSCHTGATELSPYDGQTLVV